MNRDKCWRRAPANRAACAKIVFAARTYFNSCAPAEELEVSSRLRLDVVDERLRYLNVAGLVDGRKDVVGHHAERSFVRAYLAVAVEIVQQTADRLGVGGPK